MLPPASTSSGSKREERRESRRSSSCARERLAHDADCAVASGHAPHVQSDLVPQEHALGHQPGVPCVGGPSSRGVAANFSPVRFAVPVCSHREPCVRTGARIARFTGARENRSGGAHPHDTQVTSRFSVRSPVGSAVREDTHHARPTEEVLSGGYRGARENRGHECRESSDFDLATCDDEMLC